MAQHAYHQESRSLLLWLLTLLGAFLAPCRPILSGTWTATLLTMHQCGESVAEDLELPLHQPNPMFSVQRVQACRLSADDCQCRPNTRESGRPPVQDLVRGPRVDRWSQAVLRAPRRDASGSKAPRTKARLPPQEALRNQLGHLLRHRCGDRWHLGRDQRDHHHPRQPRRQRRPITPLAQVLLWLTLHQQWVLPPLFALDCFHRDRLPCPQLYQDTMQRQQLTMQRSLQDQDLPFLRRLQLDIIRHCHRQFLQCRELPYQWPRACRSRLRQLLQQDNGQGWLLLLPSSLRRLHLEHPRRWHRAVLPFAAQLKHADQLASSSLAPLPKSAKEGSLDTTHLSVLPAPSNSRSSFAAQVTLMVLSMQVLAERLPTCALLLPLLCDRTGTWGDFTSGSLVHSMTSDTWSLHFGGTPTCQPCSPLLAASACKVKSEVAALQQRPSSIAEGPRGPSSMRE